MNLDMLPPRMREEAMRRRIAELEAQIADLNRELKLNKLSANEALATTYRKLLA